MKNTAVLFDLDGTLWDASEIIAPAWNDYCAAHGINHRFTPADCRSYCGKTLPEIAAVVFPDADPAWREAVITGCCDAECIPLAKLGGKLYPDLKRVLTELRREHFLAEKVVPPATIRALAGSVILINEPNYFLFRYSR